MSEPREWSTEFTSEISFADGDFVDLGFHQNQMTVLPLVFMRGEEIRPLGTCFGITSDGLCVTARHVIEEAVDFSSPPQRSTQLDPEKDGIFGALYISPETDSENPESLIGGLLPMHSIYSMDMLDIALIKLILPVDTRTGETVRFPAHPLRLKPPEVGELTFGMGYRKMSWTTDSEARNRKVRQKYSATRGTVEEVHLGGRDKVMLPFPCFRMSSRFDGGMSGGPILDQNGRVFGVICSSFAGEEDTSHVSYGSLVAPAMAMTLEVRDPDGTDRAAFLWDLVEGGGLSVDSENVTATRAGDRIDFALKGLNLNARLGS